MLKSFLSENTDLVCTYLAWVCTSFIYEQVFTFLYFFAFLTNANALAYLQVNVMSASFTRLLTHYYKMERFGYTKMMKAAAEQVLKEEEEEKKGPSKQKR